MKTKNEIVEFLEKELNDAYDGYEEWKKRDSSEAIKYRIKANTLEHILEEVDYINQDKENEEKRPVTKTIVEMPKKEKQKRNFLTIYLNIFSVVVFFTSLFFVEDCISYLVERFDFLEGIFSALLHYGYLLIHGLSYYFLITKTKLLNLDNLNKR